MDKGFGQADPSIARYVERTFGLEDPALFEIRRRSDAAGLPPIAVSRFDARHLEVLAAAIAARRVVEIGTLAGYSGISLLRGMPPDGVLHTFEVDPNHAAVARETFQKNSVGSRAVIHVGPALSTLREIEALGPFDLVFIDADKESYPGYLEWAEKHLRTGGLLIADNAVRSGGVSIGLDASSDSPRVAGVRAFNDRLANGGRFRATMLPTEEGLAVGVRLG
jgi:caffeoyl-CoA O-methyltransferase